MASLDSASPDTTWCIAHCPQINGFAGPPKYVSTSLVQPCLACDILDLRSLGSLIFALARQTLLTCRYS